MNCAELRSLLSRTFSAWNRHEARRWGAALAFYTILSLAPLVILAVAGLALFFGNSSAQNQLLAQARNMIHPPGSEVIKGMIEHVPQPRSGIFASFLGLITLLFGASGVFGELRSALNTMWEVKPESGAGFWSTVKQRLFSFGMVLAVGFLLLVYLVISAALAAFGKFFGAWLPLPELVLGAANFVISLAGVAALFALIFRYVPETKVGWKEACSGAAATAFLFTIGKSLIGLYLGKTALGSAYGAAGSLVVLIVWVYYSAMIFLLGAEFTRVLDSRGDSHGS
jgi:membrane protein